MFEQNGKKTENNWKRVKRGEWNGKDLWSY